VRVRPTGLYALERLAKTYPGHRQVIVNALCASLQVSPASIWAEPACTRGEFMLADSGEVPQAVVRIHLELPLRRVVRVEVAPNCTAPREHPRNWVRGAFPSAAPTTLYAATTGRVILGAVPAPLRRCAPIE
jgi:hypothetical protein